MHDKSLRVWEYFQETYRPQSQIQSPETVTDYETWIGQFYRWWLGRGMPYTPPLVSDLTRQTILQCRDWKMQQRGSASTANHLKRVLTAIANHAAERGFVPFPGRIRRLKEPDREPRAWSLTELAKMIAVCGDLEGEHEGKPLALVMEAFYRWAYDSGCRISSLLATDWAWFHLASGEALVPAEHTKDKQDLPVELSAKTREVLMRLGPQLAGLVFGHWREETLRMLHKRIVYAALVKPTIAVRDVRGAERVLAERVVGRLDGFHKLRRTTATEIAATATEEDARKAMGHSSLSVLRRYLDRRRTGGRVSRAQRPEIPELPGLVLIRPEEMDTG